MERPKTVANIDSAAIAFIIVLNASFVSLLVSSGLFWVPMSKTERQEGLGWDGAHSGLCWARLWGGAG